MKKKKKLRKSIWLFLIVLGIVFLVVSENILKGDDNIKNDLVDKLEVIVGYQDSNKKRYIEYLNNNDAPLEDVVYLVNNDINYTYSKELVNLSKEPYFIKDNIELYLNNLGSDYTDTIKKVNTNIIYKYYSNMKKSNIDKDNLILVNKYYYLESDYEPSDLEEIDPNYNRGVNNKLRKDAKDAFEKMCAAAILDNIKLYNVSAYRSYQTQERIYNRNLENKGLDETDKYSARPGSSEHQTGLALDINSLDTEFANTSEYKWLINNAYKFGFILRYPKNDVLVTGYSYEPWHYRYVGLDAAKLIMENDLTFEEYYAYYVEK